MLDDEFYIEEAAILLCATDAVLGHDNTDAEEALIRARDIFKYIEESEYWSNGRHDGDCTNQPHTCIRCFVENFRAEARKQHDE